MTDNARARIITGDRRATDATLEMVARAAAAGLAPCAERGPRPFTYAIRLDNRAVHEHRIVGLIVVGSITGRPREATIARNGHAKIYRGSGQIRAALTDCLAPVADD
jgi:hypothetical protein